MQRTIKEILKPIAYPIFSAYYRLEEKLPSNKRDLSKDEYGKCSVCGLYTRFWYNKIIDTGSKIVVSCGFDKIFTEVINITNSLHCKFCLSKYRVRCAATSLLNNIYGGKFKNINELIKLIEKKNVNLGILETSSTDGIFTRYDNLNNVIKSEYFDDVKWGEYKNKIRSENLQALIFEDNSIDIVVALDVFEHVAEPMVAFSEVHRVLKTNGIAIITVPIDDRIEKTSALASVVNGMIEFHRDPAYHSDPLREEGALVFTEFGMDIVNNLKAAGYNITLGGYTTKKSKSKQYVLVLKK